VAHRRPLERRTAVTGLPERPARRLRRPASIRTLYRKAIPCGMVFCADLVAGRPV
jgi:hypothetical protein